MRTRATRWFSNVATNLAAAFAVTLALSGAAQAQSAQAGPQPGSQAGPQMVRRMRPAPPPAFIGERGEARLDLATGSPIVEVLIQGRAFRFLIDTGAAGHGRIKADVAAALGLAVIGEMQAGDGSGAMQVRRRYALPEMSVAGIIFQDMQLTELPVIEGRPTPFDGVIGLHAFGSHLLTLDYAQAKMSLSRDTLPASDPTFDPSQGGVLLGLRIGSVETQVSLDTGNSLAPLILPEALVQRLQTTGEPRMMGRGRTAISSIEIREVTLVDQVSVAGVILPVTTATYPSLGSIGNLGSRALRTAVVRLDQRNTRIEISLAN